MKPKLNFKKKRRNEIPVDLDCYFCKLEVDPDYKDVLKLRRFISDRGKIIKKARTGNCSMHQRILSKEIRRARFLSLLPYTERHAL